MRQLMGKLAGFVVASAAVSAIPTSAFARSHGGLQVDVNVPGPVVVESECRPEPVRHESRVWVEPIYRVVSDRQWAEPVYQTVTDRVWVEESTKNECVRVWVPDRYETRDVVRYEWGRRVIHRQQVCVEPAHFEDRPGRLIVVPAHFEDVQRQQLVCEGHWQNVERRELVSEGHWEYRREYVSAPREVRPGWEFELRLPFGR